MSAFEGGTASTRGGLAAKTGLLAKIRQEYQFRKAKMAWSFRSTGFRAIKRAIDMAGAAAGLFILSPLLILVAAAIKLDDPGPVLFWQTRIGRRGKPFRFPKFRSMVVNAEKIKDQLAGRNDHGGNSLTFKMKSDPRVTRVGRIIRRFSIDELPQLWCVLNGKMSLVGPRPALVKEVALYNLDHRRRLEAVPGLTCIWQVNGRGDVPFEKQLEMDLDYIERQSPVEDLKLFLKTIPSVLHGRGAY